MQSLLYEKVALVIVEGYWPLDWQLEKSILSDFGLIICQFSDEGGLAFEFISDPLYRELHKFVEAVGANWHQQGFRAFLDGEHF